MIQFNRYCGLHCRYEVNGEQEKEIGAPGMLLVALVSSGRVSVHWENELRIAGPGTLVIAHEPVQVVPLESCHIAAVALKGGAPEDMRSQLAGPAVLNSSVCTGAMDTLARLTAHEDLSEADASAIGYTLLCSLAAADAAAAPLPPLVARAIAQIRTHYAEVYGVEELAKGLHVSKAHLVRSFSAATGVSPGRYLTTVRVEAAKRLLAASEYSLDVIASLCGFSGANYLIKVFKRATGETPASWRRAAKKQALVEYTPGELEAMLFL